MGIPDVNIADWSSIDVLRNFIGISIYLNDGEVVNKRVDDRTLQSLSAVLGKLRKSKNFYAIDFIYRVNGRPTYQRVQNSYKIPMRANSIKITKSNYVDNISQLSYIRVYGATEMVFLRKRDGTFLRLYSEDVATHLVFGLNDVKRYLKECVLNGSGFSVKVIDISGKEHNYNY